jgi:hypothetical protein
MQIATDEAMQALAANPEQRAMIERALWQDGATVFGWRGELMLLRGEQWRTFRARPDAPEDASPRP